MSNTTTFQSWLDLCLKSSNSDDVANQLKMSAYAHFDGLSSSTTSVTPSNTSTSVLQDISNASSITANGALALLLKSLGPAFNDTATISIKVCALHCLMGALEGSKDLTHGVRQAVGRFLVELCRPGSNSNEEDDDDDESDNDQHMNDYVDSTNLTSDQVTQQLQSMSAKKQSKQDTNSSYDDVRDAAISSLKALLCSNLEIFPTQQSSQQTTESKDNNTPQCPIAKAMGVVFQSMELRVELAMLGINYRCQSSDSNTNNEGMWGSTGAGYEQEDTKMNIEDGLSQLSRIKRSLCFYLLDGALDGLKVDELQWRKLQTKLQSSSSSTTQEDKVVPTSLLKAMSSFTSMASSCMHGETDPRCLVQLLLLLNKVQQVMLPLFNADIVKTEEVSFPSIEIFDAVAPYYPIQFTPPKNDPHRITRSMLQDALLAVLCERGACYKSDASLMQKSSGEDEEDNETMITLSARMFMERLEPPKSSDYDPPSNGAESESDDKAAAVKDLSSLFLPRSSSSTIRNGINDVSLNVTRVAPTFLTELSSSLARVHEDAVSTDEQQLASAIRKFSSSLAYYLEPGTNKTIEADTAPLWEAYIGPTLSRLIPTLESAPQGMHGRASTAYFASLAAEGGLMSLNRVLDCCYPRFLGVLSLLDESKGKEELTTKSSRDEEKLSAAMRGIGALISSCRVALTKWQRDDKGLKVHPHPLSSYLSSTVKKVSLVLNEGLDEVSPLSLAAVAVLESLLTCADLSTLEEEALIPLETSIVSLARVVLNEAEMADNVTKSSLDWKTACARVLGAVVSLGLSDDSNSCEKINELATSLLPEIMSSATSPQKKGSSELRTIRFDWISLAGACSNGTSHVSERIVSDLLSCIIAVLQSDQDDQRFPVMALSYIARHGGQNVGNAFHSISCSGLKFDIIEELCQPPRGEASKVSNIDREEIGERPQLQVGMSTLQLPESRAKDEEVATDTMKRASTILPFLIPVYECPSSASSCDGLVQFVDQIMPPLSETDEVNLFVVLPLLAAALTSTTKVWETLDSATLKLLSSMVTYLAEFSISSDHNAHSRSAAATCLFSILFHRSEDGDKSEGNDVLVIQKLLQEVVLPTLICSLDSLKTEVSDVLTPRASGSVVEASEESVHSAFSQVEDTLNFVSMLGSAAACKGGSFSQTGDKIAIFLIELACSGTSQFSFTETQVQLITPSDQGQQHPLLNPASHVYILPASAFGSMLSVHTGGPFWRQRMTHKTRPILMKTLQSQATSQNPPALGTLAVVCHMLCCLPSSLLGSSNIKQILPTLLAGLVYFSKNSSALAQSESISSKPADLLSVILAALVKTLTVSPEDLTKFIGIIIPSLLLLSSPSESSEAYIPKQIIVLQCIEIIATNPHARNSVLREKDQVVAVLSAVVDHPSLIVRTAVVQARNIWCTLT